jgi:transcription antitermination protein NusB
MTSRRRAREVVLQLLYEEDQHPEQDTKMADVFLVKRLHGNRPLVEFARALFKNVLANRKEIDKTLGELATNWSLRRMAAIDRNILRLGAYEITMSDTPGRVAINEAVELAKRYGDRQSSQFVNGILDRVFHCQQSPATTTEATVASPVPASSDAGQDKPKPPRIAAAGSNSHP